MKKEIIILCIGVTILSSVVSAVVSTAMNGHHRRPPFEQNFSNDNFGGAPQGDFHQQGENRENFK